ncbi:hypothetical protein ABS774_18430 [Methylobacterium oxalidis]
MVEAYAAAVSEPMSDADRSILAEHLAGQLRMGIAISTDLGNYVGSIIGQWEAERGRSPGPKHFVIDMHDDVTVAETPSSWRIG